MEKNESGFTLSEILVGVAVVGVIAAAFLNGMVTTSKAVSLSQETVSAENLVRSQIEYIRIQDYVAVADYPDNPYELIEIPADLDAAGYSVDMNPPETILSEAGGYELQKITVAVKRDGKAKLVVSIYRVSD